MAKQITDGVIEAVYKNLKTDYPSVTLPFVKDKVEALVRGERPTDIIGMFAKSMLTKAGYLGDPDADDEE